MSIHDGHRQRLKNRFLEEGLDHFDEINVLELLLFYCIPRKDTNPTAHALIEHFGSLVQVLEAPAEELVKVPGISENVALYLNLVTETGRYYMRRRASAGAILSSVEKCGAYMLPYFVGKRNETVYLLCLDAKCKALCCKEISEGSINYASISTRKVVETALAANATSVVLAHNHPSGVAYPSPEDIQTTHRIAVALQTVDVQLVDHLVVADDDFVSLAQSGYYNYRDIRALV